MQVVDFVHCLGGSCSVFRYLNRISGGFLSILWEGEGQSAFLLLSSIYGTS